MKSSTLCSCFVVLAASVFLGHSSNVAAQPFCGSTITSDTTLSADLIGCLDRGLRIGASNVTLDCDGHIIEAAGNRAVEVNLGHSNVTVKNCVLVSTANTDALRVAGDSSNILITDNDISTSGFQSRGIRIFTTSNSIISNNKLTTIGLLSDAVRLSTSSNNLVTGNTISTAAEGARGFLIDTGSENNLVSENTVHTRGVNSNGVRLRAGSDGNAVIRNVLRSDNTHTVRIESSSNNLLLDNTLASNAAWLRSRRFTLQNGGLSVHPVTGEIFAVENIFGGAGASFSAGTATAFVKVDALTGKAVEVTRVTLGGANLLFGFDALEITPSGRFFALRGGSSGELYEIDPLTGEASFIFGGPGMNGLESIDDTSLFATSNDGTLFRIDLSFDPPLVFFIGNANTGIGWTDIAVHPLTGVAYALSRHADEQTGTNHLYQIDTGNGGVIQEFGDTAEGFVADMDFAPDGTLYGNGSELLVIDPGTAVSERVGAFGEDPLEPPSINNVLTKTSLISLNGNGSVHYPDALFIPDGLSTDVTTEDLEISYNRVFVDSESHPFLDQRAVITLLGLPGEKRRVLVDEDDDGVFERCTGKRCRLKLFRGGTLIFDVDGFTTYSSAERVKGRDDDEHEDDDD